MFYYLYSVCMCVLVSFSLPPSTRFAPSTPFSSTPAHSRILPTPWRLHAQSTGEFYSFPISCSTMECDCTLLSPRTWIWEFALMGKEWTMSWSHHGLKVHNCWHAMGYSNNSYTNYPIYAKFSNFCLRMDLYSCKFYCSHSYSSHKVTWTQ